MLLAAYSVVELQRIEEPVNETDVITIYLKVLPDNKLEPGYLPLTNWH